MFTSIFSLNQWSLTTSSLLLSIFVLVVVLVIANANRRRSVAPAEDRIRWLPGPRGIRTTIKDLLGMRRKGSRNMYEKTKTYGKIFGIGSGEGAYVIIMDYAHLEEAFVTKADLYSDRGGIIRTMLESVLPERGSIFNNGTAWDESRGFVAKTLKNPDFGATTISRCISDSLPILYSKLDALVEHPLDPKEIYQSFFIDVFHRISFGVGISYLDEDIKKFIDDLDNVVCQTLNPSSLLLSRPSLINSCLFRGYRSKLRNSSRYVKTQSEDVLEKRHAPEKSSSLIALFAKYVEDIRLSGKPSYSEPEDGWVIVYNMFFAAADTIHEVLLWLTLFLAAHSHIQVKMRNEIETIVNSGGTSSLYDQRSHLPVVMSTILEVLRMRPAAPMGVPHIVSEAGSIGGYSIPKGSQIFPNIWGMHNDLDIWEDPGVFNPNRFLDESGKLNEDKAKLVIPFSIGPRSCPGEQVARRIIFQTVVSMVTRYRISLPEGTHTPRMDNEKRSFTMNPERFKVVFVKTHSNQIQVKDLETSIAM
ncbi:cytochrome P450 2U1-like isoform X1 [Lytechinus variegatus]|uniref:cytochrome P450 2U1-like isoform X1 n=1 Tax=Lytechinus variegatus TaxID=7654 RepID=UPI001BB20B6F|nr:cytochrome P450 2U1-like isoform X1 [Lytechinus variegatus]